MARQSINNPIQPTFDLSTLDGQQYAHIIRTPHGYIIGIEPEVTVGSWQAAQKYIGKRWLLGYIGYEQGYRFMQPPRASVLHSTKHDAVRLPNVHFGVYKKVIQAKALLLPKTIAAPKLQWKSSITPTQYNAAFKNIMKHIKLGNIYQANLSYRMSTNYTERPLDIFTYLHAQQAAPYSAYIQTPSFNIMSSSPELLFSVKNTTVESHPMKGTLARTTPVNRVREKNLLRDSVKEKSELDMIIDVHRNDLARIAKPGSVKVKNRRRIRGLKSVWQADAVIQAKLVSQYSVSNVVETMVPGGSITGAPKLRAMEILHELEPVRRNVYCGSIGYIAPNGDAQFNVAIRTAYQKNKQLHYHVGGGIVFDSNVKNEFAETQNKAYL